MFIQINRKFFVWVFILSSVITGASPYTPLPASTLLESMNNASIKHTTSAPAATSGSVRFAVIGDYGDGSQAEADVANRVKSWNPDFIITTGDNNYPYGAANTIDAHIGQFYHDFIYPYTGAYGAGATFNRFFPTLGNNDLDSSSGMPYLNYFTLPGNERYYDYVWGPVHFFVINSDGREPDGNSSSSTQATWLRNRLAASTSLWNVVYLHLPPYSSGSVGSFKIVQWPFASWGADVVMSGHSHTYERIFRDGIVYFVNGLGGDSIQSFSTPISGSQFRYNKDFGAMLVGADNTQISFKFINRSGTLIDSYSLHIPSPIDVYIGGVKRGSYYVPLHGSTRQSYYNLDSGPVKVTTTDSTPILTSERFIYSYQNSKSYAEMMGYPSTQLASGYWFPWYNNISYSTQLRVTNLGASTQVKVYAGGVQLDSIALSAGQSVRKSYTVDNGPLHVFSADGVTPILASERFIQTYKSSASYAEMMGYPGNQLTTQYWFPWYNNISYSTQLRVSNLGNTGAQIKVYAGTTELDSFTLAAGQGARKSYTVDDGPLHVVSTDGVTPILASERFIYTYGNSASYAEMMGYPGNQLTSEYCFPWYNNTTDGGLALASQLRVSNMGTTSINVKVTLAGGQIDSFSLAGGEGKRKSYASFNNGPLCVVRTSGTAPILASERFISTYLSSASYSEIMGYPTNRLAPSYWFPWYNNLSYSTELRLSRP